MDSNADSDITTFLSPRKNYQGNVQLLPNHMANKPRQPRWKLVSYPSQLDWSQSQRGSSKQLVLVNLNQMEVNEWVIATQPWAINGVSKIGLLMVIFTQLHCKAFSYITSDNRNDQWTSLLSSLDNVVEQEPEHLDIGAGFSKIWLLTVVAQHFAFIPIHPYTHTHTPIPIPPPTPTHVHTHTHTHTHAHTNTHTLL